MERYTKPVINWPLELTDGDCGYLVPRGAAHKADERVITYAWILDRALFGEVYWGLLPEYFMSMPQGSGVLIGTLISSKAVSPNLVKPGDIDVLVIPFEGDELILSHALAIEIKIIRASFMNQQKSPNEFGFSQAKGLLGAGFPYVAVGHLIVSDCSPKEAWREIGMVTIEDAETGLCSPMTMIKHDCLPLDLLNRAHGRLKKQCPDDAIGHFAAYVGGLGVTMPEVRAVQKNTNIDKELLDSIYEYYQMHYKKFLKTWKFPPSTKKKESSKIKAVSEEQFEHLAEKFKHDFK